MFFEGGGAFAKRTHAGAWLTPYRSLQPVVLVASIKYIAILLYTLFIQQQQ
jgi:hypothetical protein